MTNKLEEIAFNEERINGLKQKNAAMAREIANREITISNIHKENMVLEQELRWEEFISYCNSFC